MQRETLIATIGAVVALVLDVVLSPNMMLFSATPNFVIAYVVVLAMVFRDNAMYLIAFVLGILCDCLGYGPVGALAFLLLLVALAAMRLSAMFDNGSMVTAMIMVAIFVVAVEFLHAFIMLALTSGVSAIDAIVYLALPCSLFDAVLALIMYPIVSLFFTDRGSTMGSEPPSARIM